MKRLILIALLALSLGFGLTLMASTPSMAVHKGSGDLTCGNCHTMHSSQGGTFGPSMGGANGALILLRSSLVTGRETIHQLCLQCHAKAGSQAGVPMNAANAQTTPPKVLLDSTDAWDSSKSFSAIGAGGDFQFVGTYNQITGYTPGATDSGGPTPSNTGLGKGHSIGATTVAPPGNGSTGGATIATFSCTTCHDPHGTASTTDSINRFRNLKGNIGTVKPWTNMSATGDIAGSYVGGVAGGNNLQGTVPAGGTNNTSMSTIWPVWRSSGTQNTYNTTTTAPNIIANVPTDGSSSYALLSAFCAQCHSTWHEGVTGSPNKSGNDWARHPVDNRISDSSGLSGAGVSITDMAHYTSFAGISTGFALPAANDDGTVGYYATSGTDKVFCLSCHFAHGSPYYDILRWDYISAVESTGGSQTGNGVPSNRGCQQCHNR